MLSRLIFGEVRQEFFRILTGTNAPLFVDVLDALDRGLSNRSEGISRAEAVEVVCDVLAHHPDFIATEELVGNNASISTPSEQAHVILNRLVATGWLQEPSRPDYQRILYFDSSGEIMLDALRRIANPALVQFTDKLQLVCAMLMNPDGFRDRPWGDLEACQDNARLGLLELRQMQKSVERYTKRQIAAQTLRESLQVLYDEFSETIGHSCYRQLVTAHLPTRLIHAQRRLDEIISDEAVLEKMQREVMRRDSSIDATTAMNRVRLRLDELARLLEAVQPQAETVDQRTAEFSRRSLARFQYLQAVGSSRRQQAQDVFEWVNQNFAGRRLADLDVEIGFPNMLILDAGLFAGLDSLYTPRIRRTLDDVEPIGEELTDEQREECLREMEANLRDSLPIMRANRFVERLALPEGIPTPSSDLPMHTDDDIADVIACLLHAESVDATYRVTVPRVTDEASHSAQDHKAGYSIDRFTLEKK